MMATMMVDDIKDKDNGGGGCVWVYGCGWVWVCVWVGRVSEEVGWGWACDGCVVVPS